MLSRMVFSRPAAASAACRLPPQQDVALPAKLLPFILGGRKDEASKRNEDREDEASERNDEVGK